MRALASPDSFQQLKDSLTSNPQLTVTAMRAPDYYGSQTEVLQRIIRTIGGIIAVLMGIGAVFGAVITMYTAVASRTREIATLRALGFGSFPVVFSVLAEAVLLGIVGGIHRRRRSPGSRSTAIETATMNFQSFSQIAFAFKVTPQLMANGARDFPRHGDCGRTSPRNSSRQAPDCHSPARALRWPVAARSPISDIDRSGDRRSLHYVFIQPPRRSCPRSQRLRSHRVTSLYM